MDKTLPLFKEVVLESVYISGSLSATIASLSNMKKKYGEQGFGKLNIRMERDCGHPFYCECDKTLFLFGTRAVQKGADAKRGRHDH